MTVQLRNKKNINMQLDFSHERAKYDSFKDFLETISLVNVSTIVARELMKHDDLLLLIPLLENNKQVKMLDLTLNSYDDDDLIPFFSQLGKTGLEKLILCGNRLTEKGVKFLLSTLRTNHKLIYLNLSSNDFSFEDNECSDLLIQLIETNRSLQILSLGGLKINDTLFIAMINALRKNHHISDLRLIDNEVSDASMPTLVSYLENKEYSLRYLNLKDNSKITSAGAKSLLSALDKNFSLLSLVLSTDPEISNAIFEKISSNKKIFSNKNFDFLLLMLSFVKQKGKGSHLLALPNELLFMILEYVNFTGYGRRDYECAKFIFNNSDEFYSYVKNKQTFRIIEKNKTGQIGFFVQPKIFASSNEELTVTQNIDSLSLTS